MKIKQYLAALEALKPYRIEPTVIIADRQWYKVVDRNGVPLVNHDIAEDKARFIVRACNSHQPLLEKLHTICRLSANPLTTKEVEARTPTSKPLDVLDAIWELSRDALADAEKEVG